jgi:hypothetical protein
MLLLSSLPQNRVMRTFAMRATAALLLLARAASGAGCVLPSTARCAPNAANTWRG